MTGPFSVKLNSKKGHFVLRNLNGNTTIAELKGIIATVMQVRESQLHILYGFPPRSLDRIQNNKTLSAIGFSNNQTLTVEDKQPSVTSSQRMIEEDEELAYRLQTEEEQDHFRQIIAESARNSDYPTRRQQSTTLPYRSSRNRFNGVLIKKVVPGDNSCLFTSIRFVLNGKLDNETSERMRQIIAEKVAANPHIYNDAILGKSNAEYCAWIKRLDSWGGAIEISILSNYYGIEIDVVDVQNAIINRFGEDKNYKLRVFLLFDGIHYDPLYMESGGAAVTIFPIDELGVYQQAEQLANEVRSSRHYGRNNDF